MKKLETPEDIEKWREERRKNFPTAENVKKKVSFHCSLDLHEDGRI